MADSMNHFVLPSIFSSVVRPVNHRLGDINKIEICCSTTTETGRMTGGNICASDIKRSQKRNFTGENLLNQSLF